MGTADLDCPKADDLARDDRWWEIYDEAFPAEEREPREVILDSVRRRVGLAFRARLDDATIGLATTHVLFNPPAVFLVYLATAPGQRGAGLGGRLLDYSWEASAARLRETGRDALGLAWEVDAPETAPDGPEAKIRKRRISFFSRHGGIILARPYLQPPVNGVDPIPMRLMFRPAQHGQLPDAATLGSLIRAMYIEKYSGVNGISEKLLDKLLQ